MLVVTLELANTRRRLGSWAVVVEERSSGKAVWGDNGRTRRRPVLLCAGGAGAAANVPWTHQPTGPLSLGALDDYDTVPVRLLSPHDVDRAIRFGRGLSAAGTAHARVAGKAPRIV